MKKKNQEFLFFSDWLVAIGYYLGHFLSSGGAGVVDAAAVVAAAVGVAADTMGKTESTATIWASTNWDWEEPKLWAK